MNKKQALGGVVIALAVGLVVSYYIYYQGEKEVIAAEALSNALAPQAQAGNARKDMPTAFLKVANEYPGTRAGAQAVLHAATALFTEGNYNKAQAEFQRFLREHPDSPLAGTALLGVAACFDATGETNKAAFAYKDLIDRHPNENVVPQAKFALAQIYEAQNQIEPALNLYESVGRDAYSSVGAEAGMRAEELKRKYPKLAAASPAPLITPALPTGLTNKP